ncbi:Processing alpha glucosidase I [Tulasnella sp. 419]|nr:Processing alpha glucosidase I [Tulasnella sp. 419]
MWFGTQDFQSFSDIRHSCEDGHRLSSYTWTDLDVRQGGIQVLKDPKNNVEITTEFLKVPGGKHGGSWAARIKGRPLKKSETSRNSLIFYLGREGLGSIDLEDSPSADGLKGTIHLSGMTPDLGEFKIRIEDSPDSQMVTKGQGQAQFARTSDKTQYFAVMLPDKELWRAKEYLTQAIVKHAQPQVDKYKDDEMGYTKLPDPSFILTLPNTAQASSNFYAFQKTFDGAFQFDVFFESSSAEHQLEASTIDNGIAAVRNSFDAKFQSVFPVPPESPQSLVEFSKAITSNLFGGIGYFYGTSIEDRSALDDNGDELENDDTDGMDDERIKKNAKPVLVPPRSLFTATPSRSFFPRGFYWDEGFHLAHIGAWDIDLSLEILKSWIDLIDADGWVGREQILGEEARSRVPQEFQTQYPTYANPPTLTMALAAFVQRLKDSAGVLPSELGMQQPLMGSVTSSIDDSTSTHLDPEVARNYLLSIYPSLRRHYDWFRRTQRGQIKQWGGRNPRARTEGYRWRGRSKEHVLTSGLDDYPRAETPHIGELHVDLISWVAYFSRSMRQIAEFLGNQEDEEEFRTIEENVLMNIDDLHWNEEQQLYCDASVDDEDESYHECHRGYVSLFPFLLELLPSSSPHLKPILDLVRDPKHLWSAYGIRSLSASHPLFGKGENYWRGPIWIQMNYLALRALHNTYAAEPGPYYEQAKEIYTELRKNIIDNVFKEYERTGYVWEQYDAVSGEGKRSHPFTGWTSLVTLILSEKYY